MKETSQNSLRFAGYAALFGITDAARDTIQPGAFARTLRERAGPVPLFWQHNPEQVIGTIEAIEEDDRGLRVIGRIDNHHGRAASMLKNGEASGISFGYRAREFHKEQSGRILNDIELYEVSLVTHPLQHGARVHLVT